MKFLLVMIKGYVFRLFIKALEEHKHSIISTINMSVDLPEFNEKQEEIIYRIIYNASINILKQIFN